VSRASLFHKKIMKYSWWWVVKLCYIAVALTFLCPPQNCGWAIRFALLCPSVRLYVRTSRNLCAQFSPYTPWRVLFIPTHSDQHDMKMTVNIGFCDAASFTRVMGLSQFISKFIIIVIPSGDVRLCEKIYNESFTWLHNHSSWQRAVYGGIRVLRTHF